LETPLNTLFVKIKARPEKQKELTQTLQSIVERVRQESGCLHAGFYQDVEHDNEFLVVQEWASQRDSDNHVRSDIFTVLVGAGSLMHRPPAIVLHTVSRSTELNT
jgi:quinol monooxygenase YgiN